MLERKYPDWCIAVFLVSCLGLLVSFTLTIGGAVMGNRDVVSGASLGGMGWLLVIYVVMKRTKLIYEERGRKGLSE
jgi:phosphate/sulfate permease